MKNPSVCRCLLRISLVLAVLPAVAHAHPGHDGHELTWDLSHLAAHPFATLGWLALFGFGLWRAAKLVSSRAMRRRLGSRGGAEDAET
jgi:hydrogenase/urease accessory protein HupE